MATDKKFKFTIIHEPTSHEIYPEEEKAICFTVTNLSGRPVTVRPELTELKGPRAGDRDPLPERRWRPWLTITEPEEVWLNRDAVKQFKVHIKPSGPRPGTYKFRLGILGIEDTDRLLDVSDEVNFTVPEKAVSYNFRRYAIIAMIILAVVVLGIVGGLLAFTPKPRLQIDLETQQQIVQGQVMTYTLSVLNTDALEARDIVLRYTLPEGITAAVARVEDATYRHCDAEDQRVVLCGLGSLQEGESVLVSIQNIPEPSATTISHVDAFALTARFGNESDNSPPGFEPDFLGPEETTIIAAPVTEQLFAYGLPSLGTVAVGEPYSYRILAWHMVETEGQLWATYKLPSGLRYASSEWPSQDEPLAAGNCRPTKEDYFTLMCNMGVRGKFGSGEDDQQAEVSFRVVPTEPLLELNGRVVSDISVSLNVTQEAANLLKQVGEGVETAVTPPIEEPEPAPLDTELISKTIQETTYIVDSALFFDGFNDWVEINYSQVPSSFTVDMWVTPFSTNNNQALIGAHLPRSNQQGVEIKDGTNLFLVGYYNDGLDVRVGSGPNDHYTLDIDKKTERFHLAIVVKQVGPSESQVFVYIDGEIQNSWTEISDKEEACNRQCKVYASAIPNGIQTLNWVLGQDWDSGSLNRHTSDFFSGTLSDFRIWRGAQENVVSFKDRHVIAPGSQEAANLIAYWRLAPVSDFDQPLQVRAQATPTGVPFTGFIGGDRREIADPQNPQYRAALYGPFWGESGVRYGNAVRFDGTEDGLVSNFTMTALPVTDSASAQTMQVNVTLSTWIFVDNVPTEDQWIVGYAPLLPSAFGPQGSDAITAELREELDQIDEQVETSAETVQQATEQTAAAQGPLEESRAARDRAVASVLNPLLTALGFDPNSIKDGLNNNVTLFDAQLVESPQSAHPTFLPRILGPLRLPAGVFAQVEQFDTTFDASADALERVQTVVVNNASAALQNVQTTGDGAQAELAADQAVLDQARADLVTLSANIDTARGLRNAAILAQEDYGQFRTKGIAGYRESVVAANPNNVPDNATIEARYTNELIQKNLAVYQANNNYIRSLLDLLNLSNSQRQAVTTALDALENNPAYRAMLGPDNLDNSLSSELRDWLDANGNLTTDLSNRLDTLEESNSNASQSELQLFDAQENQEAALFALRDANARQEALNNILNSDAAKRLTLNNLLNRRRDAQADIDSSEDPATAQAQLAVINSQLEQERQNSLAELKLQLASTQAQEEILNELSPVLQVAIDEAYDAGRKAVEQQALENIADKILAQFLGIQPCNIPPKSTGEAVFDAAKLAVQLSVLNDVDGRVKTAEVHLAEVSQQQQCRQTQINGARENLKDTLIQLLENYLRSINADVDAAQQALDEAKDEQSNQEEAEQVTLPEDLLDLLAEAIANEVSVDLTNYLCAEKFEFDQLVCNDGGKAFGSNEVPRFIPFIGSTVSFLTVKGGPDVITDLNIRLRGTHSYMGDLSFTLIGPDGTSVDIIARSCGPTDNFNLMLDDTATGNPGGWPCPPNNGGNFRPSNPLAVFNDTNSNGQWKLVIRDSSFPFGGFLQGWSLQLQGFSSLKDTEPGGSGFLRVFSNLKKFQSGETQVALNERKQNVGTTLNDAFNTVRFRSRWQLRTQVAFINEQLRTELQEGIENATERQSKLLLQTILVDMDTTLRVLLNETDFNLKASGSLEPDIATAVSELERRERYAELLDDLKSLTKLAKQQLEALSLINGSAQPGGSATNSDVAPLTFTAAQETEAMVRLSLENTLAGIEAAGRKVVFLGKRAVPGFFQDAEPTPVPEESSGETGTEGSAPVEDSGDGEETAVSQTSTAMTNLAANVWIALVIDSDGHVTLVVKPNGSESWTFYKENIPVPTGEWLHYAGTVSYTITDAVPGTPQLSLYRNGEAAKEANPEFFPTNIRFDQGCSADYSAGFYFGSLCDDFYYEGQLDDVRLWQRALDKNEVGQWLLRPREVFDEFVYWSFDEGPGTNICPVEPDKQPKSLRNVACDIAPGGSNDIIVVGPKWTDAHFDRLHLNERIEN